MHVKDMHGVVVEEIVKLDGATARTTAMAASGSLCVAARDSVVFSIDYYRKVVKRLFTARSNVVHISLDLPFGAAALKSGEIVVFVATGHDDISAAPGGATSSSCVLTPRTNRMYTYSFTPARSIVLRASSWTIAVVDQTGAVEVIELPPEQLRRGAMKTSDGFGRRMPAQARVMRQVMLMEEGGTVRGPDLEESVLVARSVVSEEAHTYCRPTAYL